MRGFSLALALIAIGCSGEADAPAVVGSSSLFEGCPSGAAHAVNVAPDLGEPWRVAFEAGFAAWDPSMARAFPRRVVVGPRSGSPCDIAIVPAHQPAGGDHFAVTEPGVILVDDPAVGDDADFRLAVATHEVGHVFGLGHARTFDSVMWHIIQPGVLPSCLDLDGARAMWNETPEFCAPISRERRKATFHR